MNFIILQDNVNYVKHFFHQKNEVLLQDLKNLIQASLKGSIANPESNKKPNKLQKDSSSHK